MRFNKVLLCGNLTKDPELSYTKSGKAVCSFRLATDSVTESGGPLFIDCVAWERQAENCDRYLRKGSPAFIEGMLKMEQWSDKETGAQRSKVVIMAHNVQFLDGQTVSVSKEHSVVDAIHSLYGESVDKTLNIDGMTIHGWHLEDESGKLRDRNEFSKDELAKLYWQGEKKSDV